MGRHEDVIKSQMAKVLMIGGRNSGGSRRGSGTVVGVVETEQLLELDW